MIHDQSQRRWSRLFKWPFQRFLQYLIDDVVWGCQEISSWDAENPRLNNSLWLLILLSSQSESGGKDYIRNKCSLEALDYGRMTLKNNQHNLGKTFMKRTYPARRKSKNLEPNFGPCFLNCPPKKSSETHLMVYPMVYHHVLCKPKKLWGKHHFWTEPYQSACLLHGQQFRPSTTTNEPLTSPSRF